MTTSDESPAGARQFNASRIGWTLLCVALLAAFFVLRPKIEAWLTPTESDADRPAVVDTADVKPASKSQPKTEGTAEKKSADAKTDAKPTKFAGLKDIGRNVKLSPAGLRYTPGSEEGHRLKHVLRHDNDLPDRPGSHGVFDGEENELLAVIDEAYVLAKAGGPRVKSRDEEGRTVHEVDMQRKIGFLGGQEGKRRRNPALKRVRLVLDGDRVITAFPF